MIPRTTPELDAQFVGDLLDRRALATSRPKLPPIAPPMVRRFIPRRLGLAYPMPTVENPEPEPVLVGLSPVASILSWLIPAVAVWYWWKALVKRSPFYTIAILLVVPAALVALFTFLAVKMATGAK